VKRTYLLHGKLKTYGEEDEEEKEDEEVHFFRAGFRAHSINS